MFDLLKAMTKNLLENPHANDREWTLQGFGMLRTYFGPSRIMRLHVWSERHAVEDVSLIHTHPWGFKSGIIAGNILDTVYERADESRDADRVWEQRIMCGPGGGLCDSPLQTRLREQMSTLYGEGESYAHFPTSIHSSHPDDGTVTMIKREFGEDVDHASVFWPVGTEWVSAEPRLATRDEVDEITRNALERWF